jgi:nicotinamide phosphoribosyltransferase
MILDNPILATDSYKLTHWNQYPPGTEHVYSYFESRVGAHFDTTVFFGLQAILPALTKRVFQSDVDEAAMVSAAHFGNPTLFNRVGWEHVVINHHGLLPLEIRAVPEGTKVGVGNVMMTVTNTCPKCYWLTNAVESLLTHVWYPSTVCSLSYAVRQLIIGALKRSSDDGVPDFMLHDFGYRGATTHEAAALGGAAHLVNFKGTDTLPAILLAMDTYDAKEVVGFSVPATEHSVMTALGSDGEDQMVEHLLRTYPTGVLSVVGDSYNIIDFTRRMGHKFRSQITARDGVFVLRPDSVTSAYPEPALLVVELLGLLRDYFGTSTNLKGFKVLDPHVRLIWGDGIDIDGIKKILSLAMANGYSAENLVFGMGGGLLQKVNRDTQRFAFKASAICVYGEWTDIYKRPLDRTKTSKAGHLALINGETIRVPYNYDGPDELELVFLDGHILRTQTFEAIRALAIS